MRADAVAQAGDASGARALVCAPAFGDIRGAVRLMLPGDPVAVRAALARLCAELDATGIAGEDVANAELVLAEALNNIVEHAFATPCDDDRIEMTIVAGPVGIGCELRDNGRPMPSGRLPCTPLSGLPSPDRMVLNALPEGGFGWHLIRSLARNLCYAREEGANRLVFRIPYAG